ncbi:MAG: hypothetical protein ACK41E_03125 [Deinococcales bacterium]
MNQLLREELPYQTLCVFLALEILVLAALSPRTTGVEPVGFHALGCLRLCALTFLGSLLYAHPPRHALTALTLWGIILAPPELWAFALEARDGIPPTLITSVLCGFGAYGFARIFPNFAQIFPALGVLVLFVNGFMPSLYSVPMLVLFGSSTLFLFWQFFAVKETYA